MQDERGNWLVCCVKGCDNKPISLGLCVNHFRLNRKYGSPVARRLAQWRWMKLTFAERFWTNVRKGDGCWLWQGAVDKDGYGLFNGETGGSVYVRAHRFSYALHDGPIPSGHLICHSCDNPSCVRPDHLFAGTPSQNTQDMLAKGRQNMPFGAEHHHAKLTEAQVLLILDDPRPHSSIALEYNVSTGTISDIKRRRSWPHLGSEPGVKAPRISPRRGKSDKGVTPEIVRIIRASEERGIDLAVRYGLKPQDVSDIRHRRSWAHIE